MRWRGDVVALFALALGVRAMVAARTHVPGRDGATYLWMAEQVAGGDLQAAFATVFHPLYPLLVGGLLALLPGLGVVLAGQVVASGCGALAVLPLFALTEHRFGRTAALVCGLCYALGLWVSRYPAECMSEGPFYLAVASWAHALLGARGRPAVAGAAAALAFAARPEGLVLLVCGAGWGWHAREGLRRFLVWAVAGTALVPLGYALAGAGISLTPKVGFNLAVGVGASSAPFTYYLEHFARTVGSAFEAIGYLVVPLAVVGGVRVWTTAPGMGRGRGTHGRVLVLALVTPLLAQLAVVPLLRSYLRFLSGLGVLALPLVGAALSSPLPAVLARGRWLILALALAPDVVRLPLARGADRLVERDLGLHLRALLAPGQFIATEMPRLEFFAGQRPGPPRPIARGEVLARCQDARTRFAVIVAARTDVLDVDLRALGFAPLSLPSRLSMLAEQRGLLVYHRS